MREALRGALLSVLFFALILGGTPGVAVGQDDGDVDFGEVLTVIGKYFPVPKLPPSPPVISPPVGGIIDGTEIGLNLDMIHEATIDAYKRAIKEMMRAFADEAGHTPEKFCRWYDENYKSKGASAVRLVIIAGAALYMYWDLRDKEGRLSLKEIEWKKQLAGFLTIVAAGGLGDAAVRDLCNVLGTPIW